MNSPSNASTGAPGWFGKLPALGDFVTRRLPQSFVRPWDAWITPGVEAVQRVHGEFGREALLTFPIWRFVVPPHVVDSSAWFGLFAPSVDRVGRCFPLTVAQSIAAESYGSADLTEAARTLEHWISALTAVLDDDDVVAFDAALAAAPPLSISSTPFALDALVGIRESARAFVDDLAEVGSRELKVALSSRILWWTDPAGGTPGLAFASECVASTDLFNRLFGLPDTSTQQPLLLGALSA